MVKILIVEDHHWLRKGTAIFLEAKGLEVRDVESGEDALEGDLQDFDIIFVDWRLEGMFGDTLVRRIREEHLAPQAKIVGTSSDEEGKAAFERAGVDAFHHKLKTPNELYALLMTLV